jgi:hypothetical protein
VGREPVEQKVGHGVGLFFEHPMRNATGRRTLKVWARAERPGACLLLGDDDQVVTVGFGFSAP